jgi:hypothetical protein
MGVKAIEVVNPFEADLARVEGEESPPTAEIRGADTRGGYLFVDRAQNNAYVLVNRLHAQGKRVLALGGETRIDGHAWPAGTFVIERAPSLPENLRGDIEALGLRATVIGDLPEGTPLDEVRAVRLGLYQPWTSSMDEGWTRWVLERFEFPYRTIHDAEIRAGELDDRYDVIVLPDIRPSSIVEGNAKGSVPKKYTGGIGEAGIFSLRDFVSEGGTLVGLDSSCGLLVEQLELPVREIPRGGDEANQFFCPGSILRIHVDRGHPLAYGLPAAPAIMFSNSPVFERIKEPGKESAGKADGEREEESGASVEFIGAYPRVNPLLSGWIENDDVIHGKGALVHASFEKGSAVLIGFRCQFRAQSHGTFKVLFNAILEAGRRRVGGE